MPLSTIPYLLTSYLQVYVTSSPSLATEAVAVVKPEPVEASGMAIAEQSSASLHVGGNVPGVSKFPSAPQLIVIVFPKSVTCAASEQE